MLIELGPLRVLTDPVLRARVAHLRRHVPVAEPPARLDAVLVSHLHRDHADVPSLRTLAAPVIGPPGTAGMLRRLPIAVDEVRAGERVQAGGAHVLAVRAEHDGRRGPLSARRDDDALGFVVEGDRRRTYFAGDTEVHEGMGALAALDVALLPIWGWGTTLGAGHMDPLQAAQALALLRPAVAVPIHWGTFLPLGRLRSHGHLLRDPVDAFRARAAELAPDVRIEVLAPGGSLELDG